MSDKHPTKSAVRRTLVGLLVAIGLVAVPGVASGAEFNGHADDPRGDSVADEWSIAAQDYIPITPDNGNRAMDLTRAEVYYDSDFGTLRITYIGKLPRGLAHQGTFYSGRIATSCGASDLTFIGGTSSSSSGGELWGSARLEGPSLPDGVLDGFFFWGDEGVTFVFTGPALVRRDYRCVMDLQATWIDSGNTRNRDWIVPFCLVAGCLDPPVSAAPPGSPQVVGIPSVVVAVQGARINPRCSILPGKIKATTARMKLMQRASHNGSASHRRAVTRQVRVLASRRINLRATYKALCT